MFIAIAFFAAIVMLFTRRNSILKSLNCLALITVGLTAFYLVYQVFTAGPVSSFQGLLYWDALSAFMLSVIVFISGYVILFSFHYMEADIEEGKVSRQRLKWYYFYIWLFIGTMLLVVSTPNLGILWVGIEGTTLATTLLVGFYRQKQSVEAAWKYIILCTVGISFALLGTLLLYAASGQIHGYSLATLDWRVLDSLAKNLDSGLLKLAFLFALVGYGTKIGLVPMHPWLPDAHSQAPSPVSAMLSGVLLNCAMYAVVRWHILIRQSVLGPEFSGQFLVAFGIISLGVMVAFILLQKDVKRLLAYSSVEHMGILALGFGLNNAVAVWGATLHLLLHALTKANLFVVTGRIVQKTGTRQILKIRGVISLWPYTGLLLLLGLLAITGTPPFGTFRSKLGILIGVFQSGRPVLGFLMVLFLTVIFAGFLYHFSSMLFGKPSERINGGENIKTLWLAIPVLIVLAVGFFVPEFLDNALLQVVHVVMGGVGNAEPIARLFAVPTGF